MNTNLVCVSSDICLSIAPLPNSPSSLGSPLVVAHPHHSLPYHPVSDWGSIGGNTGLRLIKRESALKAAIKEGGGRGRNGYKAGGEREEGRLTMWS